MDGRRLQRWILCGALTLAGTGCKSGGLFSRSGNATSAEMAAVLQPASAKKSFWGSSSPTTAPTVQPMPVVATKPKKTGPMPDFEAAAADLRVEQAFADPPPPNRDGLLDMARIRYQRALKADAKHKGALLGLARLYARLDDRDRALEAYRDYFKHYPKDAAAHHEIAQQMAHWKDWEQAVSWCDAALKIDPENRSFRKTKGFCLAMGGRWEEAFTTLSEVMSEAQARHNLAGLLDHLGHSDACRQQLQLALQADPGFAPSREFLAELDGTAKPDAIAEPESGEIQTVSGTDQ